MSWWLDFYDDLDSLDIARAAAWYSDDIELQVAGQPVIHGREAAAAALDSIQQQLKRLVHEVGRVVAFGDEVFLECGVLYEFKDGRKLEGLAAVYMQREAGKLSVLHIFQHLS